ncbi:MAG: (5-formylfuran-3-yl)methyl phosphate synthase [Candidatus Binatia bacterium]
MLGGTDLTLLLVSPRDINEALAAVRGGADILDIKNPEEGSLGANFPWIIAEVRRAVPASIPISAAIGDFPNLPGSAALAAFGALRAGASIIKVGLKGPKDVKSATYLVRQVVRAVKGTDGSAKVAVCAYGDYQRAGTIDPLLIPRIASKCGADIAMVDTAIKDGQPLTDFLREGDLKAFINKARSHGLRAAFSGSLGYREVRTLRLLNPEVIGVRGAACEGGDRKKGKISERRVRRLKKLLGA